MGFRHVAVLFTAFVVGLPQTVAVVAPHASTGSAAVLPTYPRRASGGSGGGDPCAEPTITGTGGDDRLTGTGGDDVIAPGAGDDRVDGVGGDDVICGGKGKDTLVGGPGDDRLYGDAGADYLRGGSGRDRLDGGGSGGRGGGSGGQGGGFVTGGGGHHDRDKHHKRKHHKREKKHKPDRHHQPKPKGDQDVCASGEQYSGCEKKRTDPGFTTRISGGRDAVAAVHAEDRVSRFSLDLDSDYFLTRVALDQRASYAYEFDAQTPFSYADITIPYLETAATTKSKGKKPKIGVYGYDQRYGLWVRAPGKVKVDTKARTVTARVRHFSVYSAFFETPGVPMFSGYWASKPRWCAAPGEATPDLAVAFVIGTGASMATSDPAGSRAEAAKQFVDAMRPADTAAVVGFNDAATVQHALGPVDAAALKAALDRTKTAAGGNNLGAAVRAGVDQLTKTADEGRPRIGVLVSDGPGPIADTDVKQAVDSDVVFYTVSVGGGDTGQLQNIARETGGRFFALTDPGQLAAVYGEVRQDLTDPGTDTDGDRVTDCVERRGALVAHGFYGTDQPFQSGRYARTDPRDTDTDDDTLGDGDELGPLHDVDADPELAQTYAFLVQAGIHRFYNPSSNPMRADSDGEGLSDPDERRFRTDPYVADTDGDGSTDKEEVSAGLTSPIEANDWIWAGRGEDGTPENIPGLAPLTLIRPEPNEYPWDYDVMGWSTETGDCSFECREINDWAQAEYDDQGWFCQLMTSCQPDDLRQEWIEQAVDVQGLFTYDEGFLREELVRDYFAYNCQRFAARSEECFSEEVEEKAEEDYNYQDLAEGVAEVLANLPGGRRPPDPEVDEATRKLDRLAKQACREVERLPEDTPQRWGQKVHERFEELIGQLGDTTLFGETGYRNGQVVAKVPGKPGEPPRWPDGTTAPDAVFGDSPNAPRAAYDLKTGEKPIQSSWIRKFGQNLLGLIPFDTTVELIELTC